jgi:hypothetical protein
MDFIYYIIRKNDMVIVDGAEDMVNAIKVAQQKDFACLILQGCVITEVGQDLEEQTEEDYNIENEQPLIIEEPNSASIKTTTIEK